jgi:prevent-host-death family protein
MASTSKVGVRELRQNLSVYLDRVKRGETLTVTEHRQAVAVLQPPVAAAKPLDALITSGGATAATREGVERPRPLRLSLTRSLSQLVRDQREDRF